MQRLDKGLPKCLGIVVALIYASLFPEPIVFVLACVRGSVKGQWKESLNSLFL